VQQLLCETVLTVASLWRPSNSKFFIACFRDDTGRQRRISTKETNRRLALKIAEAYEQTARKIRTKSHVRRAIERLHEELGGEPVSTTLLRTFAQNWITSKKPTVAKRTLEFYSGSIVKFLAWLGNRADRPISEISKTDLIGYRDSLALKLRARSVNHDLSVVRMLFVSARRDGLISDNPAEFVEAVRQRNSSATRRAFTLDEIRALIDIADPEWRSMILVGLYTGQRLGDIAQLTWNNIDLPRGELRLVTQKTGKVLLLPIAGPLQRHLESLPSSDDPHAPLHPRALRTFTADGRSAALSNQFAKLLILAGLRQPEISKGTGRSTTRRQNALSFHCLRKTATTLLYEAGVPQAVCEAMIGHDSAEVHALYISIGKETLRAAAANLPSL
jgi:integrase